jgi:hypothetical protein
MYITKQTIPRIQRSGLIAMVMAGNLSNPSIMTIAAEPFSPYDQIMLSEIKKS